MQYFSELYESVLLSYLIGEFCTIFGSFEVLKNCITLWLTRFQMSTRRRKFSGRGMEEGADPTKFADLAVHVDDLLPPVAVIEDAENAARMPDDIPIIDTLVVDGVVVGKEKMKTLAIQIFIPFLLAGFGMVGAGILLDAAQVGPVSFLP